MLTSVNEVLAQINLELMLYLGAVWEDIWTVYKVLLGTRNVSRIHKDKHAR